MQLKKIDEGFELIQESIDADTILKTLKTLFNPSHIKDFERFEKNFDGVYDTRFVFMKTKYARAFAGKARRRYKNFTIDQYGDTVKITLPEGS